MLVDLHPSRGEAVSRQKIGEVLVDLGHLGRGQVEDVLASLRQEPGERFGARAIRRGLLDEVQVTEALARQFHLQMVSEERVGSLNVSQEALALIPAGLVRDQLVVPTFLDRTQRVLSLLVADPTNLSSLKSAQEFAGASRLRLFVATPRALRRLVGRLLPEEHIESISAQVGAPPPEDQTARAPQARAIVLETDLSRLAAIRGLDQLERTRCEFVHDPDQVTTLLANGEFNRVYHRAAIADSVEPHMGSWRRVCPDLSVASLAGYSPAHQPAVAHQASQDFLLRLVEFSLLAGETQQMEARARTRRAVHLARQLAAELRLTHAQRDTLLLGAMFLFLDQLSVIAGLIGDETHIDEGSGRRFELALAVLEPLAPPYPINRLFTALEARLLDPSAGGGGEWLAEILFTLHAVLERGRSDSTDAARILGDAATYHDPAVLQALSTILRREQLLGRLAREGTGGMLGASTIVVAEREAALVTAIEARLSQAGYEVVSVANGADALERVRTLRPVALIANQRLPRRDGLSVLLEMRRDKDLGRIPVIIITDRVGPADVARGLELGAEDVLEKPINLRVLLAKLRKVVGREQPAAARSGGIVGRLSDLGLPDLLQTLYLGAKTAEIIVTSPTGRGSLYADKGQVVSASYGAANGEQAVYDLVTLSDGLFEVRFGVNPPVPNISQATDHLLLEAMRRLDESNW